jgi:two-component system response regulator NreC
MKTTILLADDHTIMRSGLRMLLEKHEDMVVVGEADDGRQAVRLAMELIEATRQIVAVSPKTAVVVLSMHSDEGYVMRALKYGAKAYLLKDSAEADLIRAVRAVREGKSFFSPKVSRTLLEDYVRQLRQKGSEDTYDLLSSREREILQLIAEGKTNKEIANIIKLSLHTVETHRTHILQKLNLHSVSELILYAVRKGIIS